MTWMQRGFCRGADPEIFSDDDLQVSTAKAYCQRCPVSADCLAWALKHQEYGVWGGTTRAERRKLMRVGPRRACPVCPNRYILDVGDFQVCASCGLSWKS